MTTNHTRGVSNLLFWYIVISVAGVTYVVLNLSYKSSYVEYAHAGYNLAGNDTVAVKQHGEIVEVASTPEKPYYTFIICIITAPDHTAHRDVLRQDSWAGYDWRDDNGEKIERWRYVFVVGRTESKETMSALQAEMQLNQDMVMTDEIDSYHNLILKVLWLLQHTLDHYNFAFLVKTDDDSFINVKLLNNYLQGVLKGNGGKLFFGGARTSSQPVLRRGRYGVSKDLWEPDYYPPYCSGSGYVLSYDTVQTLLRVWESNVQPLFYVEDAFVGVLAYHAGNIDVKNIRGFYWHHKYGCSNRNALLMHYVQLDLMKKFMLKYEAGQAYC